MDAAIDSAQTKQADLKPNAVAPEQAKVEPVATEAQGLKTPEELHEAIKAASFSIENIQVFLALNATLNAKMEEHQKMLKEEADRMAAENCAAQRERQQAADAAHQGGGEPVPVDTGIKTPLEAGANYGPAAKTQRLEPK